MTDEVESAIAVPAAASDPRRPATAGGRPTQLMPKAASEVQRRIPRQAEAQGLARGEPCFGRCRVASPLSAAVGVAAFDADKVRLIPLSDEFNPVGGQAVA
jgi:hypothetical protein